MMHDKRDTPPDRHQRPFQRIGRKIGFGFPRRTMRQPREGASDPKVEGSFGSDAIALARPVENRRQSKSGADGLGFLDCAGLSIVTLKASDTTGPTLGIAIERWQTSASRTVLDTWWATPSSTTRRLLAPSRKLNITPCQLVHLNRRIEEVAPDHFDWQFQGGLSRTDPAASR
jgi:hypothetical protein